MRGSKEPNPSPVCHGPPFIVRRGCHSGTQEVESVGNRSIILKKSYAHQDASMESTSNEGKGVDLHTLVDRERKRSNERG